jgi:hypothetical protein
MGIGAWRTRVELFEPITVNTADGGYTDTLSALDPPQVDLGIRPAGPRDLERVTAGTVASTATHVLEGWIHPGVTTQTVIKVPGPGGGERTFSVLYVGNPDGLGSYMELLCAERVK